MKVCKDDRKEIFRLKLRKDVAVYRIYRLTFRQIAIAGSQNISRIAYTEWNNNKHSETKDWEKGPVRSIIRNEWECVARCRE